MTKGLPISVFFVEFQPEFKLTLEFLLFHTGDFSLAWYQYSHLLPSDSSINLAGQLGYLRQDCSGCICTAVGHSSSAKPSGEKKGHFSMTVVQNQVKGASLEVFCWEGASEKRRLD